jgi:hypothetical protein
MQDLKDAQEVDAALGFSSKQLASAGIPYISEEAGIDAKGKKALNLWANVNGVRVVTKAEAASIRVADTAEQELDNNYRSIRDKLPGGAAERVVQGPINYLAAKAESDPALTSYMQWRGAQAIPALLTMPEPGLGFRTNTVELRNMANTIPTGSDTQDVGDTNNVKFHNWVATKRNEILGIKDKDHGMRYLVKDKQTGEKGLYVKVNGGLHKIDW